MNKQKTPIRLVSSWTDMREDIGRSIKMKRVLLGISHQRLAAKTNIAYETLCAYEAGDHEIPLEHLYRIALAMGVNMYTLIPESFY